MTSRAHFATILDFYAAAWKAFSCAELAKCFAEICELTYDRENGKARFHTEGNREFVLQGYYGAWFQTCDIESTVILTFGVVADVVDYIVDQTHIVDGKKVRFRMVFRDGFTFDESNKIKKIDIKCVSKEQIQCE